MTSAKGHARPTGAVDAKRCAPVSEHVKGRAGSRGGIDGHNVRVGVGVSVQVVDELSRSIEVLGGQR